MRTDSTNRRRERDRTRGLTRSYGLALLLALALIPAFSAGLSPSSSIVGAQGQRRPALLNSSSDRFVGRFVLVAETAAPSFLQQPQLLARVADYELIAPPVRLLGNAEETTAWVRQFDFKDVDGVILSLDAITSEAEVVHGTAANSQGAPLYGFTGDAGKVQTGLELVASGDLDFLLIADAGINAAALGKEIASRNLTDRVALDDGSNSAAMMLLARMLNRRFGFSPKIVPVFPTIQPGGQPGAVINLENENRRIAAKIRAIDGWELPKAGGPSITVEGAVFIHPPGLTDAQRLAYVESIAQVGEKGVRVGVVDLSQDVANKEALVAALRAKKLFDKLITYSSSFENKAGATGDALNAALSQMSAGLLAFRFLRDDVTRVRRVDNAQTELLFHRYLSNWAYPIRVKPALDAYVRDEMKSDPNAMRDPEAAGRVVKERLQPIADVIFKEQFHHNVHAVLLSGGGRAVFEISLFQRFQARFTSPKTSDPEFLISIHSPQISMAETPNQSAGAEWTLTQNQFEDRVQARVESVDWNLFKTDTLTVELGLKTAAATGSPESYRIVGSRKRKNLKIEITAQNSQGAFYALSRLEQLGAAGGLTQDFQIAESPAFARRGVVESGGSTAWLHRDRLEMLKFLGRIRINRYIYAPQYDPYRSESWRDEYPEKDLDRLKQLVVVANENFVEVVYSIQPDASLVFSNEADLKSFQRKLDRLSSTGLRRFLIDFDKLEPTLTSEEDRAKFKTLASAQGSLVTRIHERLKTGGAGYEIAVLPTGAALKSDAAPGYLKELAAAIPTEAQLIWKPNEAESKTLTDARVKEWTALTGRKPLILDSFPVGDPLQGRLVLGPKRGASPTLPAVSMGFLSIAGCGPRLSMLALTTAAQYAWDPQKYDPARALDGAVAFLYDQRAQPSIRAWVGLFDPAGQAANLFDPLFASTGAPIALAPLEPRIEELQKSLDSIVATREQGLLRGDLAQVLRTARKKIAQLKSDPAYEKLPNGDIKLRK